MVSKAEKKLRVFVTSLDGNLTHPFEADDTVAVVHQFAYEHLVKEKEQIPMERTWMEHDGQRQGDGTALSTLAHDAQPGAAPDLTLSLAWETGGGQA